MLTVGMSSTSTVTALIVVLVLATPATLVAIPTETTAAPTAINSCTVIDEPGQYTLTEDVVRNEGETSRWSCFDIQANDVVLRGGGHVVNAAGAPIGIGVNVQGDNVTITNLTVREAGVGIRLEETNGSTVADNDFDDVYTGIELESGSGNTIPNNTVHTASMVFLKIAGENNTVVGNRQTRFDQGSIVIEGENNTVANNTAGESWFPLNVEGKNHTIVGNDLAGGDGTLSGGAIRLRGTGHEIAHNELNGAKGVLVESATGPISIHHNRFRTDYSVKVLAPSVCASGPKGADVVSVHNNTFEQDRFLVPPVGVLNKDDGTVNATNNYWGASDGPSSMDGENVSDPVTGTLANGSGVGVSDGVNFDPWRSEPVNQTAT